ncbi:hypothetical protein U1Q18_012158 [Sarracenia purpurea var. burkii]
MKSSPLNSPKKAILLILTIVILTTIPLYLHENSSELNFKGGLVPLNPKINQSLPLRFPGGITTKNPTSIPLEPICNIFNGTWVEYPGGAYYTNTSECEIDDRENCMKFGRPDTEFLKWRWKPNECELPIFHAAQFLELVRGKFMAFVGDSVGRNQMQSLMCLLASVARPVDLSRAQNKSFRHWLYVKYNFTLATFWSTHLVRAYDADPNGFSYMSLMNLHLDEVDEAWSTKIENFDYVIVSVGPWFFRPMVFYEKGQVVGCHECHKNNVTELSRGFGYRMAFRTTFRTLLSLPNYKGITFLRTISPPHFENGEWNTGGTCGRTRPFKKEEKKLDGYTMELYLAQVEEFWAAKREGRRRGLKFRLLDTTEAMVLRPDGHPGHYGHGTDEKVTIPDCVHWCLPGPIDAWNEFLLQMLKMEGARSNDGKVPRNVPWKSNRYGTT